MIHHGWRVEAIVLGAAIATVGLSGCGTGVVSSASKPAQVAAAPLQGVFIGGQQPVGGVAVQLYQAEAAGY
jgi:hypothetical protein